MKGHRPDESHPEYARLASAVEAIQERFGEPVRLAGLAAHVGLSMDRFERLVKQVFHVTPRQLLVKTRVDAASRLLPPWGSRRPRSARRPVTTCESFCCSIRAPWKRPSSSCSSPSAWSESAS